MVGTLAELAGRLKERYPGLTAEILYDALWLSGQGVGATSADDTLSGTRVSRAEPEADPDRCERRGRSRYDGPEPAQAVSAYLPEQVNRTAAGPSLPTMRIRLPDSPALPGARGLARTLRPLRYDPHRVYPADSIDEEETARRIAMTGVRLPVQQTTRRRRLDLDLVLDLGGSGLLFSRLAAELRTMLEIHGAFCSVRPWVVDTDADDLTIRPGHPDMGFRDSAPHPSGAICPPSRRPLVMLLTDGTGKAWRTRSVHEPLREWARYGTVVLIQVLPARMWNRTGLLAVPATFYPAGDGYQRGARLRVDDVDLAVTGLSRNAVSRASVIPVIGLDDAWLRSWLPLLRGTEAGAVSGYALIIPTPEEDERVALAAPDNPPNPEERVQRFGVIASKEARRLAQLLSVRPFNLAVMRKIASELVPGSGPATLAEVLLGGLVYRTTPPGARVPTEEVAFEFYDEVRGLLQERPGGKAEFTSDTALVEQAVQSSASTHRSYQAVAVRPDGTASAVIPEDSPPLVAALTIAKPVAVASGRSDREQNDEEEPGGKPATRPVRIGIWGSGQSGRTTFVTVLGLLDWQTFPGGNQWRVVPANKHTREFISVRAEQLRTCKEFPPATLESEDLSFNLLCRRPRRRPMRWWRPARLAEITVTLQDIAGGDFLGKELDKERAPSHLSTADAVVYFFDPTYDAQQAQERGLHSVDYFIALEIALARSAIDRERPPDRFFRQRIAVCVPKLDDEYVFRMARRYGCVQTEPGTGGRPWVPTRHARRLFEALCRDQEEYRTDFLLTRLNHSFRPDRISFHALSSIGFWIPEAGRFDPDDVCNVLTSKQEDGPSTTLRGDLRPVHVLDPLVGVVERVRSRR